MANKTEAPKPTLEERASRAFELAKNIPLSAQVALLKKVSTKIETFPSDNLITTAEPALEELIGNAIKEKDSEALSEIGILGQSILEKLSTIPDYHKKRNQLVYRVGIGLEGIAEEKKDWHLLAKAGEFYQEVYQREGIGRVRNQLENLADETGDWRPLAEAVKLYEVYSTKEEIQRIAGKLEEFTKENDDPTLLIAAGRLLVKDEKTRERGIRLIMEGGNLNEAYRLVEKFHIWGDLSYEVEKRAKEAGEDVIWTHQQLLEGKGYPEQRIKAWLAEGNPQKALELAFYFGDNEQVVEIIQKFGLQEEAVQIIRKMELAKATRWTNFLEMSELAVELAEKAAKYSAKQIEALEQQIWLLQIQIENLEDEEKVRKLNEQLSTKQHSLVDLYLNSGQIEKAADYAEEIGNATLARQIRETGLKEALESGSHYLATSLAKKLGEIDIAIKEYLQIDRYYDALLLAIKEKKTEAVIRLIPSFIEKSRFSYLTDALRYLLREGGDSEQAQALIKTIAQHFKAENEKSGNFIEAAEMSEILGQSKLAATYRELDSLLPKPVRSGDCYITTACCEVMGFRDDCEILTNLRWLRDNFISQQTDGQKLIQLYYETAPRILERISPQELRRLFHEAIKPASDLVNKGEYQKAFELYKATVQKLSSQYPS